MPLQRLLGIAAAILLLDQLTKWLIVARVMQPPRFIEVTGFFNLVLTHNTGVSFGLFGGGGAGGAWALTLLALAVVVALLIWVRKQPGRLNGISVGLIVGGALGNVLDRLLGPIAGLLDRPGVVDFLDFHLAGWHWPAFNLADSAITVGVALLIADGLFLDPKRGK